VAAGEEAEAEAEAEVEAAASWGGYGEDLSEIP